MNAENVKPPSIIRYLGSVITEVDRPERNDPVLQEHLLAERVVIKRGATIFWVGEDLRPHFARVEHGETFPKFEPIHKRGCEVVVKRFGEFTVTQTR